MPFSFRFCLYNYHPSCPTTRAWLPPQISTNQCRTETRSSSPLEDYCFSTLLILQWKYVEIKCQLDATEVFICRSYCLLNMFRASLCPSSGVQEYYTVVAACGIFCCGFSSSWSGVELRVMRPVCRMLQHKIPHAATTV